MDVEMSNDRASECVVCFTSKSSCRMRCGACRCIVCDGCLQQYLIQSTAVLDIACINCQISWSDKETLMFATSLEFVDTVWKTKMIQALGTRIRQRYDETVEKLLAKNKLEQLTSFRQTVSLMDTFVHIQQSVIENAEMLEAANLGFKDEMATIKAESTLAISDLTEYHNRVVTKISDMMDDIKRAQEKVGRKFGCSYQIDGKSCGGIVLYASDGKCNRCGTAHCKECEAMLISHDRTDGVHVCDKDTLANLQDIRVNSRQCPKCATRIAKVKGSCDEMYCILCSTTFSWKTGQYITPKHNPERIEMMRSANNNQLPREFGDIECGGVVYEDLQHFIEPQSVKTVYAMYQVMNAACINWTMSKQGVREQALNNMLDTYVRRMNKNVNGKGGFVGKISGNIERYQDLGYVYSPYHPNVHGSPKKARVGLGSRNKLHTIRRRLTYEDEETTLTRQFNDMLYRLHMFNEAEDKYYENMFTSLRCMAYILKNYIYECGLSGTDAGSNELYRNFVGLVLAMNARMMTLSEIYDVDVNGMVSNGGGTFEVSFDRVLYTYLPMTESAESDKTHEMNAALKKRQRLDEMVKEIRKRRMINTAQNS